MDEKRRRLLIVIIVMLAASCILAGGIMHKIAERRSAAAALIASRIAELVSADIAENSGKSAEQIGGMIADHLAATHVISHRGSAGPDEHSYDAYDRAIEAGSEYIEQDLVLSEDGTLYVSHGLDAYAMTGVAEYYSSMSDERIDSLRTYSGNRILRLSDVFDRYGHSVNYVIELKNAESATVDALCRVIDEYGMQDKVTVQCFEESALETLEAVYPEMPKMLLCRNQADIQRGLDMPYVDILSVNSRLMNETNCNSAHESGKKFSVWTIDTEQEIRRAISIGADTYFTNDTPLALSLEKSLRGRSQEDR